MSSSQPLQGNDLVDCAEANANADLAVAADLCGYGQDVDEFEAALKQACQQMNIEIESFHDLRKIATRNPFST
jgi:hypothetical protein